MTRRPIIDFHCHVLPGIDDGSPDLKTTLGLLARQKEQGISHVCATPHYYRNHASIDGFLRRRNEALERTRTASNAVIQPGAEVAYFSEICSEERISELCLEGTNTLLLEMPFTEWSSLVVDDVCCLELDMGLNVVLAHPERYLFSKLNRKNLEKLATMQIPLQVNATTIAHFTTRKQGLELLQMGKFSLLGTDCHNLEKRPPEMDKARKVVLSKLGPDFLRRMDECAYSLCGGE